MLSLVSIAGRDYARVYGVRRREDVHAFLAGAVAESGGVVLFASEASRAPVFLGVQGARDERVGLLVYPFRMTRNRTRNRPASEVRGQIRYGAEKDWHGSVHPVGRDLAGVDTTLVLGVHLEDRLFVGLDPVLYDPLPMGISFYARDDELAAAAEAGWRVWERENKPGSVRETPRADGGLETLVAFKPERLLDYVRFERRAADLGLDQPLRFAAARSAGREGGSARDRAASAVGGIHVLEREFELSSREILQLVATRNRLAVAVRGGVAEHHLERELRGDPAVGQVARLDEDGRPDFDVELVDGRRVLVECKNASPEPYADGDCKVEVQKTRASKGDPASRLYRTDQFDVVAACLYAPTGQWRFRYRATTALVPHPEYEGRLRAMQRIDSSWSPDLTGALAASSGL